MGNTAPPWVTARVSMTVQDELGTEAIIQAYVIADPAQTVTTQIASAATLVQAIAGICGGLNIRAEIAFYVTPYVVGGTPVAGSRVEQTGIFAFNNLTNMRKYGMAIPSFISTGITGGHIDLTNGAVSSFIGQITNSSTPMESSNEQFITLWGGTLSSAILSFRKRRKQLSRSSLTLG